MQINWQQVQRLLVIFVGDLETESTFLQGELQKIRETSTDAEITLLLPRSQETEKDKGTRERGETRETRKTRERGETRETRELFFPDPRLPTPDSRLVDRIITHTTTWQDPAKEEELVENLRQFGFEAVIILTINNESPYIFAYLAYLAGIPIRVGRSREFGGGVLSVNSYQLTVSS